MYGAWADYRFVITFDTDGGSAIPSRTYEYNATISAVPTPTKLGYIFGGWEPAIPEKMPGYNLTVKAKWIPDEITVTFNANGGT